MRTIPYRLLHQLESEYGSIAKVPENNDLLQKIRDLVGFNKYPDTKQAMYREDIKNLLNQGYWPQEIADKLVISKTTISTVMRKNNFKIMPRFKYNLINHRANISIFANSKNDLVKIIKRNFNSLEECKNYAAIEGYKLDVKDSSFLWKDVKTGDQYFSNGKREIKAY